MNRVKHVGPDDLAERAAGALAGVVRLPARDALLHLGRGQARRSPVRRVDAAVVAGSIDATTSQRRYDVDGHERDLAGVVVLEHAVPAELGEARAALRRGPSAMSSSPASSRTVLAGR